MATLGVVLPVFALVLAGWGARRLGVLTQEGVKGLTAFAFNLALPALFLRTIGTQGLVADLGDARLIAAYFLPVFLLFFVVRLIDRRLFGADAGTAAVSGMAAVFSNNVMLGVPLVLATFGEAGLVPLVLIFTFNTFVFIPLTMLLIVLARGGASWRATLLSALAAVVRHPLVLSIAVATAWSTTGLGFAEPVEAALRLLGAAAVPCALVALGATLADYRLSGDLPSSVLLSFVKLAVHPALVWVSTALVFGLDPLLVAVCTISAALPTGSNVFVVATLGEVAVRRASTVILLTTGVAIVTVAAVLAHFAGTG